MSPPGRLRVIAGHLKGRRLRVPKGRLVRPTSERVREALFDLVAARVEGGTLLDAYAGTGAVGIEALSRGAAHVVLVESGRAALDALASNLRIDPVIEGRSRVLPLDIARAVSALERERSSFDLVFLDPPYGAELDRGLRLIAGSTLLATGGLVIVEHESDAAPRSLHGLAAVRTSRYGRVALTLLRRPEVH